MPVAHAPEQHHHHHDDHSTGGLEAMAFSASVHCLTGCAIGEIAGLMIGTALGLSTGWTIALAVSLAFLFGYALSTLSLVKAGLVNWIFWVGMAVALTAAFFAAYPVNRWLLRRGRGHALTHRYHGAAGEVTGVRRYVPTISTSTLVAAIAAFLLGGFVVSVAAELGSREGPSGQVHALSR